MACWWTFGRNPEKGKREAFKEGLIPYVPADREKRN